MSDLVITEAEVCAITHESERVTLNLYLPANLDYFRGHFPDAPILAGVVQLDWAIKYAAQHLHMHGHVQDVEVLKFQVVMTPELNVQLTLERKNQNKFTFSYQSEKGQHASGRIVLVSE
ncbi:thioester dehydrase [Pseudoalteromonas sp. SSDWG2]|uniref:ApeI family dehydratase n=1 Tax=Pseudoalteromonas sp. SSDWG2 TaxID=3139391 RepID=UPI003BAD0D5F